MPLRTHIRAVFPVHLINLNISISKTFFLILYILRLKSSMPFGTMMLLPSVVIFSIASKISGRITMCISYTCRPQWPRCLRLRTAATRLLELWVRIPSGYGCLPFCDCCVLSVRGLRVELMTRPEESNRVWCV